MPLITDEYKMAYKIYIRTIDWGNSFEFTPDVRPDKEMLGARKWSWRLYVVMGTRAVMEGLLNARADALNLEEERLGRMVAGGDDGEEDI